MVQDSNIRNISASAPAIEEANKNANKSGQLATSETISQDEFLNLFIKQLEQQDPINPMDSTQFAEQLATFSALEQQVQQTGLLEQIAAGMGSAGSLASFLGNEVVLNSDTLRIPDAKDANVLVDVPEGTQTVRIDLLDDSGNVARSVNLDDLKTGRNAISVRDMALDNGQYTVRAVAVSPSGGFQDLETKLTRTVSGFVLEPPALLAGNEQILLEEVAEVYSAKA